MNQPTNPAGEGRVEEIRQQHAEWREQFQAVTLPLTVDTFKVARMVGDLLAALATRDAALARIERGEQGIRGLAPGFYGHACQIAHEALGHGTEPYHRCPLALSSHAAPSAGSDAR